MVQTGGFGALVAGRRMLSFQYHTLCKRAACYRTDSIAVQATCLWSYHADHHFFAEGVHRQLGAVKSVLGCSMGPWGSRGQLRGCSWVSGAIMELTQAICKATHTLGSPKDGPSRISPSPLSTLSSSAPMLLIHAALAAWFPGRG